MASSAAKFDAHFERMWDAGKFDLAICALEPKQGPMTLAKLGFKHVLIGQPSVGGRLARKVRDVVVVDPASRGRQADRC